MTMVPRAVAGELDRLRLELRLDLELLLGLLLLEDGVERAGLRQQLRLGRAAEQAGEKRGFACFSLRNSPLLPVIATSTGSGSSSAGSGSLALALTIGLAGAALRDLAASALALSFLMLAAEQRGEQAAWLFGLGFLGDDRLLLLGFRLGDLASWLDLARRLLRRRRRRPSAFRLRAPLLLGAERLLPFRSWPAAAVPAANAGARKRKRRRRPAGECCEGSCDVARMVDAIL